jgi:aminoglycoside 6'-N-acetyltransferase I
MHVRKAEPTDLGAWATLRTALWPQMDEDHKAEILAYFSDNSTDIEQAYVLEDFDGEVVGFLELNVRQFAEGSRHPRIPYIEAWYIDKPFRGLGYGRVLLQTAEQWAKQKGFTQLASDTEITNTDSIAIHKQLGFIETERVACFLKTLDE